MIVNGKEVTSEEVCESLIRHLEIIGDEAYEKNYMKNGRIEASVFAIVGPNAEAMTEVFREWMKVNGFKSTNP